MTTVVYPAVVERAGAAFSVYFPDLPGCTSAGASLEEAVVNAEDALEGHLLVMGQHIDQLPVRTPIDQIEPHPLSEVEGIFLVRAEAPGRAVRINITIDEGLLAQIDRIAPNRSGFLAEAAREAIARHRQLAAA